MNDTNLQQQNGMTALQKGCSHSVPLYYIEPYKLPVINQSYSFHLFSLPSNIHFQLYCSKKKNEKLSCFHVNRIRSKSVRNIGCQCKHVRNTINKTVVNIENLNSVQCNNNKIYYFLHCSM